MSEINRREGLSMETGGKILTGVAATALLALAGHAINGEKFVDGLESSAQTELQAQGMDGVTATFDRDPLSRTAILDGDASDEDKQKALSAVLALPGVSGARWKGEQDMASANASGDNDGAVDAETKAKISSCQDNVDKSIEGKKLNFQSGSAWVSLDSNRIIDGVAEALKPCSGLAIAVSGHTDDNGDASVNKTLSQERADRVRGELVKRGIAENLITATGYGSEKPLVEGDDAQNRRIEFTVQAAGATEASTEQEE